MKLFLVLDMLKEMYEHFVAKGELVREGGRRALDVSAFRHSADFAAADAKRAAMNDWDALQLFSTIHDDAKTFIQERILRESFGFGGNAKDPQKHDHVEYKKKRARLLRAFCFMEAHRRVPSSRRGPSSTSSASSRSGTSQPSERVAEKTRGPSSSSRRYWP